MTRQESQIMKGVAILLMIFLHLFNQARNVDLCHNLIFIGDIPFVQILARAANPVAFFLILGGYGLYKVNERGDRHRWSRVLKLFIHYWIVLAIFVTIGHFVKPDQYPGSLVALVSNITSFHTTYNGEMWFLFPYVILSLSSPWLFKVMSSFKAWKVVGATLFIHLCTNYCVSRYGVRFLYDNMWIYNPLMVFHLLFSFSLGAMAARSHFFERLKQHFSHLRHIGIIAWGGVIALVTVSCVFKYNFFYAFLIISCLNMIHINGVCREVLISLGNQSMNMWMIHSWFCYYLFHDFIYSFSYPALIFIVLTAISYAASLVVNMIAKSIELRVMARAEVREKPLL